MKRIVFFLSIAALMWMHAAAEIEIGAQAAILLEFETGRVLYEKNADARLPIASATKIMTCLLAIENSSMNEWVTAGENASGVTGSSIYLHEGETLTMSDMLYGLMLRSGNDCAVAIAEHIAGSCEAFSGLMNGRAEKIGADAYFTTPNGLDEGGNGASARGIALIAREAMKNETFRTIVSTKKKIIPWLGNEYERVLSNKNRLLTDYEGAVGIKTGYTKMAGRCLVFAAEREGMLLIGAVLRCPDWFREAEKLLDYGFENYEMKTFLSGGEACMQKAVSGKTVRIGCEGALRFPVRKDAKTYCEFTDTEFDLPVNAGERAGTAVVYEDGEAVYERALIYQNSVSKPSVRTELIGILRAWPFLPPDLPCFYREAS